VYLSWAFGLFAYQSKSLSLTLPRNGDRDKGKGLVIRDADLGDVIGMDAIDGKQARRVGMASALGEMFDHGCDAINTTVSFVF
jgi:hypothetical protein